VGEDVVHLASEARALAQRDRLRVGLPRRLELDDPHPRAPRGVPHDEEERPDRVAERDGRERRLPGVGDRLQRADRDHAGQEAAERVAGAQVDARDAERHVERQEAGAARLDDREAQGARGDEEQVAPVGVAAAQHRHEHRAEEHDEQHEDGQAIAAQRGLGLRLRRGRDDDHHEQGAEDPGEAGHAADDRPRRATAHRRVGWRRPPPEGGGRTVPRADDTGRERIQTPTP
jgi:hypothetical protein